MRLAAARASASIDVSTAEKEKAIGSPAIPHFFDLRRVDGVRLMLGAAGKPLPIAASDVEEVRRLEAAAAFTGRRHRRPFAIGDKLTVRAGPLAGLVVDFED